MWSFRGYYQFRSAKSAAIRAALARPPLVREVGDRRHPSGCYRSVCPLYRRSLPWERELVLTAVSSPTINRRPS